MKIILNFRFLVTAAFLLTANFLFAQDSDEGLKREIEVKDNQFWKAYNTCDVGAFKNFFTDDVEFYHDKGGITLGIVALADSIKTNLCGPNGHRVRREALPQTEAIFLLRKGQEVYGAIFSGEHLFYVSEPGKTEWLDGKAKFVNLWLKQNGEFKMARVFSYDHRPAVISQNLTPANLSAEQLDRCAAKFHAVHTGDLSVHRDGDHLVLVTDKNSFLLYPKDEAKFFVRDRDLEFDFLFDGRHASKVVVREHGAIVDEGAVVESHL